MFHIALTAQIVTVRLNSALRNFACCTRSNSSLRP